MAFVDIVVGLWDIRHGWVNPADTKACFEAIELERHFRMDILTQYSVVGQPQPQPVTTEYEPVVHPRMVMHLYWGGDCQPECAWLSECPFGAQYDHRLMAKDLARRILPLGSAAAFTMDLADAITQIRVYAKRLG